MSEADLAAQPQNPIAQNYCFKWSDYQGHLSGVFRQLLEESYMVDVTLCAGGERIQAHRIVLCACSSLFYDILNQENDDHPTIILSDVSAQDVRSIVEFTYNGEVSIPVESINNLLEAAHSLKIRGLMEIDGLDDAETTTAAEELIERNVDSMCDPNETEDQDMNSLETEYQNQNVQDSLEESGVVVPTGNKRRKRRRDTVKKEYSEDMLASAISDIQAGHTLIEASANNNVPRSTLYMRAKALGIHLSASRNEYSVECIKAAIDAVIGGSSLQQASEMFGIPKTVLWRRIQKEGYQILNQRSDMKRTYDADKREAAVKALERGENLSKVSLEFQIPKTTLFRDKARLVDEGKLPLSFWKKRKTENEELKKSRLEEAVAACKGGKMSQAAASMTYRIPKTTIWRRLQQDGKKQNRTAEETSHQKVADDPVESETTQRKQEEEPEFAFCEVSSDIPITYIDENGIPENSVIILTTEDVDGINLEEGRQIIVSAESGQEFVPCNLNVEDGCNYAPAES